MFIKQFASIVVRLTLEQLKIFKRREWNNTLVILSSFSVLEKSDSFASHFAEHFKDFKDTKKVKTKHVREMVEMEILWQGDAIGCMKSFGQLHCNLCMMERIEILKISRKEPEKLIKSKSEIYGACKHKTKFHKYCINGHPSIDKG